MVILNDRIIRDVLIIGCNSDKAKDKIVRQGEKISLQEVIGNSTIRRFNQADTHRDEFYCAENQLCVL